MKKDIKKEEKDLKSAISKFMFLSHRLFNRDDSQLLTKNHTKKAKKEKHS